MKRNLRRLCVILPAAFLIALGAARMVRDYRNSGVFQPLFSDRKLQSNQVLFPDDATASGLDEANRSDESFWQEDAQGEQNAPAAGTNPGYLFSQDQVPSQTTGLVTGTGQPGSGGAVDGVYGITDRREDADLVISGSTDSSNDRGPSRRDDNKSNGSSGSGSSDRPSNGSSGSGDNGGSTPTPSPTPSGDYGTSSQDPASDKTSPPNTPEFPN